MDKRGQIQVTWLQRLLIQYRPKAIIKVIVDLVIASFRTSNDKDE